MNLARTPSISKLGASSLAAKPPPIWSTKTTRAAKSSSPEATATKSARPTSRTSTAKAGSVDARAGVHSTWSSKDVRSLTHEPEVRSGIGLNALVHAGAEAARD